MKRILPLIITIAFSIIVLIFYGIPFYWLFASAFKSGIDSFSLPLKLVFAPTLDNFVSVFVDYHLSVNLMNSVVVTLGSTAVSLILGVPAAYVFSRYNFKYSKNLFFWILSTRMAPPLLGAIPFFMIAREYGIYDSRLLLIIVYQLFLLPWVIWLMRSFFQDISSDIDEAAMIDGCSKLGALIKVIMPLARPGIAATAIFTMIQAWNEFFLAFMLTSLKASTLPLAMTHFLSMSGLLWGPMSAASVIIVLPIIIFMVFMQKHLVRGLSLGAVK